MALAFSAVAAVVYLFTGIFRHVWEYVSARDAYHIARTSALVVLLFLPVWFFITRLEAFPRSLPVLSGVLLAVFLAGPRLAVRLAQGVPLLFVGSVEGGNEIVEHVQQLLWFGVGCRVAVDVDCAVIPRRNNFARVVV